MKFTTRCTSTTDYFPVADFRCRVVSGDDQFIYTFSHMVDSEIDGFKLTSASASNLDLEKSARGVAVAAMDV